MQWCLAVLYLGLNGGVGHVEWGVYGVALWQGGFVALCVLYVGSRNGSSVKGTSMSTRSDASDSGSQLDEFASRNNRGELGGSIESWVEWYLRLAVVGIRSEEVASKIELHLERFGTHFVEAYGHDRLATVGRRDVARWQRDLAKGLAAATVNNHMASLSGFLVWVDAQSPDLLPSGNPAAGVKALTLPPLEPRSLTSNQVRSLKNLCDRLDRFAEHKSRQQTRRSAHAHARPWRDRAIVYTLLSTGLRREELVRLDLSQVEPCDPVRLRSARRARLVEVKGKGGTLRTVFLSADARNAVADYLERERATDAVDQSPTALFLSASSVASRRADGRLSTRAINTILDRIGRLHDAEHTDPERHISPLRPHDLRHTFAFHLAEVTDADAYELERRLGHRSQRYIARYTNPPEEVAAGYIEEM